jgi:dipeptidyl aminopeptidase/acylaminoacyl peptidase
MKKLTTLLLPFITSLTLLAQGTVDDYNRAFSLPDRLKDKVYYSNVTPQWIEKTNKFWYVRFTPQGKTYLLVDADKRKSTALFDHVKLAETLSNAGKKPIELEKLTLADLKVSTSLDTLRFVNGGTKWIYLQKKDSIINDGKYVAPAPDYWGKFDYEREGEPLISPDKKLSVFTRNSNLYVKDIATGVDKALSTDGTKDDYYSTNISWSPDSKKVAVMKIHAAGIRQITFIESSPNDQLQPKVQTRDYQKPGDVLPQKTPVVFEVATGQAKVPVNTLFANQFDLPNWFSWSADNKTVFFEYNQRGHQVYRVLAMSTETAEVRTVIEETSTTFVNYTRYFRRDLPKTNEIIWGSERDNWNHLYLYDAQTGKVKNQITKGAWYVREVVDVNEAKREIIFSANGMVPNEDPYLIRYYRIRFDGTGLTCLTPEEGMHQAWFSGDKKYLVDVYSLVNKAPVTVLRSAKDEKIILPLERADITELQKTGWIAPEPFVAKGRDGKTDIWGIIVRPTNFDPKKKYPVLEYIYAGPGSQYTPKSFFSNNRYLSPIAELGFIVIQLDGMGTSFRSKAFEEVCFRNLKDAGFPDRIAWTKALGEKYSFIDTTRIGIYGASAGGQEAMTAVLFHPEHYKAAYSSCGCHDNRMDKIWWNEQWLGYPIGKQYEENSNVVNAHLLTRPLMLVVGEVDDNVDPASTMQVCNALIKANKDFEFISLPGTNHTMGGDYGEHKRYDFFVKNLMGVTPPSWELVGVKK